MTGVERLERLVVHIEEALAFAQRTDTAHLRLALLLLDSAAELLLHRAVEHELTYRRFDGQLIAMYERIEQGGLPLSDDSRRYLNEIRSRAVSKTRQRSIERNFDAKSNYLAEVGKLNVALVRVLEKLHQYRNEAYHRDHVRADSIRSAVRIYANVVCTLLRDLPAPGIGIGMTVPDGLQPHVPDPRQLLRFDLRERIAQRLLERPDVATGGDLSEALSLHLLDRLDELRGGLDEAGGFLTPEWRKDMNPGKVLALLQTPPYAGPLVTSEVLDDWQRHAEYIATDPDALTAFTAFADLEDAFEPLEEQLHELLRAIDGEIQQRIDEARGK